MNVPYEVRSWSCWECGTTWQRTIRGVHRKIIEGNDPECSHEIHAVPEPEFLAASGAS